MTTNIGNEDWSQVEKRFDELAIDGKLPKTCFSQCIGMHNSKEFADKLFDALGGRRGMALTSIISKDELCEFWKQITDQSFDSRLQTLLDMVDQSANGRISKEEVKEIINLSASTNKPSKIQERAEEYATLIMEELDPDNLGYIELYNLKMVVVQASTQPTQLALEGNLGKQRQKLFLTTDHNLNPIKRCFQGLTYFVEENWKRLWVMALWLFISAALFTWKFTQYMHFIVVYHVMGYCVPLAKGIAETLKFNMALILLLVCRNTITWLRSKTNLGTVVPLDDNINFHMVIAYGIVTGVVLHTLTYLICIFPRFLQITYREYEPLKPYFGDKKPGYWILVNGVEGWTGLVMLLLMIITYVLAHPWFRRNKLNLPTTLKRFTGFNSFWYTHHLYIIIYVLLIIHGYFLFLVKNWSEKTTWMYLLIPMIIYACERLLRFFRSGFKSVRILKVIIYHGDVLALHVLKPQGFKYTGGQYIYVNCPDVSPFEWHPFSITSAPGDAELSLHIQTLGDWTSHLKTTFAKGCQLANGDQCDVLQIDQMLQADNISKIPKILIDGPYGAPAQQYKKYEFILLAGLGIGVTPFISILKDVLNNIKQEEEEEDLEEGVKKKKRKCFATKRAHLYWVTRHQVSLEWFKEIMKEVTDSDMERAIEIHHYCTSAYEEGDHDQSSSFISWLQSLHYDKKGVDVVSQTRIKKYSTRPNWHNVFQRVAIKNPGKRVGVFYCGSHELARDLQRLSLDLSRRTNTKFHFHKENF